MFRRLFLIRWWPMLHRDAVAKTLRAYEQTHPLERRARALIVASSLILMAYLFAMMYVGLLSTPLHTIVCLVPSVLITIVVFDAVPILMDVAAIKRILTRQGRCTQCGYDLPTPESPRCPECGTIAPGGQSTH